MPRRVPSKDQIAEFRKTMNEMTTARLEMFGANAAKYAEVLGTFRDALEKSGFSREEAMQILLKAAELPGRRPIFAGQRGHWK